MTELIEFPARFLPPPRRYTPAIAGGQGVCIHYPGVPGNWLPDDTRAARSWSGWYGYHTGKHGWNDIAYNVGVTPAGTILVGRGLHTRCGANGNRRVNTSHPFAICVLVGTNDTPTAPQLETVRRVIATVRTVHPTLTEIAPHSALSATSCPGDIIRRFIANGSLEPDQPTTTSETPLDAWRLDWIDFVAGQITEGKPDNWNRQAQTIVDITRKNQSQIESLRRFLA